MKYKVVVFTSTRAEFGLLRELCKAFEADNCFELTILVTGTHLAKGFGYTFSEIDKVGFSSLELIDLDIDKKKCSSEISSYLIQKLSNFLVLFNPDLFLVLGDRYEALVAAYTAFLNKIQIVHLHGGEVTSGSMDNGFRNAISQLSSYHFTSHIIHTNNLIKMGIEKKRIHTVGPMVMDVISSHFTLNKIEFEKETSYKFGKFNLLLTFHPESYSEDYGLNILKNIFKAITNLDSNVLITFPNIDEGGDLIKDALIRFSLINPQKFFIFPSLGNDLYISSLKLFDAVIGNSSSGIIEAPIVGIPVLNIGERQKGRTTFGKVKSIDGSYEKLIYELKNILKNKNIYKVPRGLQIEKNLPSYEIIKKLKEYLAIDRS